MKAFANIDAGICGFKTLARASSDDDQSVALEIQSDCDKITALANILKQFEPIDAYTEIDARAERTLLKTCRSMLRRCCAGCAVPAGLFFHPGKPGEHERQALDRRLFTWLGLQIAK